MKIASKKSIFLVIMVVLSALFEAIIMPLSFAVYATDNPPVSSPISIPLPIPTSGISVDTNSVNVNLARVNAQDGLIYGPGFTITSSGATGWQIKYNQPTQGQGFYESSGGINSGSSATIRTYINTNKPNGIYTGSAIIQYYQYSSWHDGPTVQYTITLTDTGIIVLPTPTSTPSATPSPVAKPDLIVTQVMPANINTPPAVGLTNDFNITIKNIGNADARVNNPVWDNKIYISVDVQGLRTCTTSVNEVKAGQSVTVKLRYCAIYKQAGTKRVIVKADSFNLVKENNEANNIYKTSVTVTMPNPSISSLSITPTTMGRYFIIKGQNFGGKGKINLYNMSSSYPFTQASIIYTWSNNWIYGVLPAYLAGGKTYGIQLVNSDGKSSYPVWQYLAK
ncbi:MAG: hypothetical protein HYV37_00435 [Candidatus Levyibacteriota bacterium]|nr:MAG: hypothetical protein HYV37_00435 [Candidatus Levybacteria bacterium]